MSAPAGPTDTRNLLEKILIGSQQVLPQSVPQTLFQMHQEQPLGERFRGGPEQTGGILGVGSDLVGGQVSQAVKPFGAFAGGLKDLLVGPGQPAPSGVGAGAAAAGLGAGVGGPSLPPGPTGPSLEDLLGFSTTQVGGPLPQLPAPQAPTPRTQPDFGPAQASLDRSRGAIGEAPQGTSKVGQLAALLAGAAGGAAGQGRGAPTGLVLGGAGAGGTEALANVRARDTAQKGRFSERVQRHELAQAQFDMSKEMTIAEFENMDRQDRDEYLERVREHNIAEIMLRKPEIIGIKNGLMYVQEVNPDTGGLQVVTTPTDLAERYAAIEQIGGEGKDPQIAQFFATKVTASEFASTVDRVGQQYAMLLANVLTDTENPLRQKAIENLEDRGMLDKISSLSGEAPSIELTSKLILEEIASMIERGEAEDLIGN